MLRLVQFCTALLALSLLPLTSLADLPPADADWTLSRDDEGIRIYSHDMPESGFQAFKAVTVLDVPLSNVMAVMVDPESCETWVHGCSHSEGLDGGQFHDRHAYSVNDLPWPAADRDYVLHIRTHTEPAEADSDPVIVMELSAVDDDRRPDTGRVRVEHSDTIYRLRPEGDGRTHMTWIQHSEPNGSLPGWLVNSLATDIPFNSLRELESVANQPEYRHHQLVFDDQGQLVDVRPSDQADR